MDLSAITIDDFKAQFPRDFPYLPVWVAGSYNKDEEVYYAVNRLFYTAKENGVVAIPTDATKWELTDDSIDNFVQDSDITRAFAEAMISFNQRLFTTDANIKIGYLYLTAHYLVNDLNTAMAGLGAAGYFPLASRSVGSVSESYSIPQKYLDDPLLSFYTQSRYGMKYLALVLPKLRGNVGVVCGATLP